MTDGPLQQLRAEFPQDAIRRRPDVLCVTCSNPDATCVDHEVQPCETCHRRVSTAHEHIEYVSQGDVTDRLLTADPRWYWEPFSTDANGLPAFDAAGGLWIKLTVHDADGTPVTRSGYGSSYGARRPDDVKAAISDALKNAAMRFGVGLDLWRQTPRMEPIRMPGRPGVPPEGESADPRQPLWDLIRSMSKAAGRGSNRQVTDHFEWWVSESDTEANRSIATASIATLAGYIAELDTAARAGAE
ncbi:MAG TPA: hypothetical protein VJ851_00830 [Jatrophihabitans sp.]|nr:hypothetical protein [Jatrophihabitans sp.]